MISELFEKGLIVLEELQNLDDLLETHYCWIFALIVLLFIVDLFGESEFALFAVADDPVIDIGYSTLKFSIYF